MRSVVVPLLVSTALSLGASESFATAPAARERWPRVDAGEPRNMAFVRLALDGASRRLAGGTCRAIFTEFADPSGRSLGAKLDEMGISADTYLSWIVFREGSQSETCRRGPTMAFTAAGHRVVYVCGSRFARGWQKNPRWAEAVVLHEALHTLGLGENPPTSDEITRTVLKRCQ